MKNKNKKQVLLAFMVAMIALLLAGCGKGKPENTVNKVFNCLTENNLSEIKNYIYVEPQETISKEGNEGGSEQSNGNEEGNEGDSQQLAGNSETSDEDPYSFISEYVSSVAEKEAANITYEIVSSEINEDDAIVKVKVSYNNYGPVAKMAFKILYDKIITNTFSGIDMNEDDMVAVFVAAFENEQQNVAIIKKTETIEVPCRYVDKKWMITDYSAIQNIYYCNIYGALSELGGDDSETEGTDDGSGEDGNQSENSPEKSAGQENASKTSNDDEPYGPGVTYFQDEGYKITVQEFVYWDSYNEYELMLTYVGHDMSGYVGDYTLSHLDDDGEIEEVSGTFHEGYDGKGKLKHGTENIPYWKENNEGTYVLTIDESMFNGRGDLRMVDKEWADANAGSVG